ncbi:MAG: glycosyltransferase family 2 protein [Anaeromicrobium sp.]|uniref:glycosyltransferase family 2 protein n=1 Tax=Anaeromicrobium sp. TaxID=1929132 RepID=UPI0025DB832F|nr:glycosyltransferase family 2 protein [Anaeromicrobium sp.]MCT4594680.1 glycosyltransferase family 2 protein [Anaeromicrobium sp.]
MKKHITVLIPVYNEEKRIKSTIDSLKNSIYIDQIVVIDDGSTDNTVGTLKNEPVLLYSLGKNCGKGHAMNYGIEKVMDNSKIICFLDGDIGHTSIELDKLIKPLVENEADCTIGKFPSPKKKGGVGLVKKLAKEGVKFYTGEEIHSSLSGQRAFKSEVLKDLGKMEFGYGVEVGMTIDILNKGYKIEEIPVNMTHRETGRDLKGFIHRGKQFLHILYVLGKRRGDRKC